jgi:hypothetical protein
MMNNTNNSLKAQQSQPKRVDKPFFFTSETLLSFTHICCLLLP